ncbi:MAG TPA: YoaK family protein [Phycisphaerae bacterium]|nr:YoaK family protein [Phycisphaerae bacterium]
MGKTSESPPEAKPAPPVRLQMLAASLTAVAGYVDAAGYLLLSKIYTANMSGNSVALGIRLAEREGSDIWRRALPIVFFFAGLVASSTVHEVAKRYGRPRHPFAVMFSAEVALLAGFTVAAFGLHPAVGVNPGMGTFCILAGLAGVAMGVQNASLRRAGALTIHTTHVTGLLLQCADALVVAIGALARPPSRKARRDALINAGFLFGLWALYVAGAVASTLLLGTLGPLVMAPAAVVLGLWVVSDLVKSIPA